MERTVTTYSAEETEKLGEQIGAQLRGGEVIELVSDLGGGKTTFTRGLARGFGSLDRVASPSFTISREYGAGEKRIYHFDLYRLDNAGIMTDEIAELVNDDTAVVIVEWADVVRDMLPEDRMTIRLSPVDENTREIYLAVPESQSYILKGVA